MKNVSRLLKVLPAGICAMSLAACGKSQNEQTYIVPEEAPKIDTKKLDAGATALRLADAAYTKGEYNMAAQLYYRAAELDPDKTELMVKLGFALFKGGSPADAEKIFRAALQKQPQDAEATRGLAHSLVLQGRAGEAVALYRNVLANGANGDVRVYAGLGAALDMVGKHEEARSAYQAGLKLAPEDFGLKNNLALSYAMSGNDEKAKAILNGLSQTDPDNAAKTNHSLSMVGKMNVSAARRTAPKSLDVAHVNQPVNVAARIEPDGAPDTREVAAIPEPVGRVAAASTSRKSTADLAMTEDGDGTIYINTSRAPVMRAEASFKTVPAMSFKSDAETPEEAAAEVLGLLQQAERGPRFVWQEARRPDQG